MAPTYSKFINFAQSLRSVASLKSFIQSLGRQNRRDFVEEIHPNFRKDFAENLLADFAQNREDLIFTRTSRTHELLIQFVRSESPFSKG